MNPITLFLIFLLPLFISAQAPRPRPIPQRDWDRHCNPFSRERPSLSKNPSSRDCLELLVMTPQDLDSRTSHTFTDRNDPATRDHADPLYQLPWKKCHNTCCLRFEFDQTQLSGRRSQATWRIARNVVKWTWRECAEKTGGQFYGGVFWFGTRLNIEGTIWYNDRSDTSWPLLQGAGAGQTNTTAAATAVASAPPRLVTGAATAQTNMTFTE